MLKKKVLQTIWTPRATEKTAGKMMRSVRPGSRATKLSLAQCDAKQWVTVKNFICFRLRLHPRAWVYARCFLPSNGLLRV